MRFPDQSFMSFGDWDKDYKPRYLVVNADEESPEHARTARSCERTPTSSLRAALSPDEP